MKRLIFLAATALGCFTVACGGGSVTPAPPASGNYSNASLNGTYAFETSGEDFNGNPINRVGSFVANGSGTITSAIEDLDDGGSINTAVLFTQGGTYSIQANGKGTLTLGNANGSVQFTIVLTAPASGTSGAQGYMIETDLTNATSSGNFEQQNTSTFGQPFQAGNYVFNFFGYSGNANTGLAPYSIVGEFGTHGGGDVQNGVVDINDGSSQTGPSGPQTFNAGGTYQVDPTNNATFGRSTITIDGETFAVYPVDQTHSKMLEIDLAGPTYTSGDVFLQSATVPTSTAAWTTGNFVYLIGSSSLSGAGGFGTGGPIARAARFTTDGSGNLNNVQADDNNNGTIGSITANSSLSQHSYTIDTTPGVAGSGRGTITIQVSGQSNAFTAVFYLISPTSAAIQETSNLVIGSGQLSGQSGNPYSNSSLDGNYAFNWTGTNLIAGVEEDFAGQYALSSSTSSNISGAIDYVELGSNKGFFSDIAITGTLKLNGDGTLRNGYQITAQSSPATTFNWTAYQISPSLEYLISIDATRVTTGLASVQQ